MCFWWTIVPLRSDLGWGLLGACPRLKAGSRYRLPTSRGSSLIPAGANPSVHVASWRTSRQFHGGATVCDLRPELRTGVCVNIAIERNPAAPRGTDAVRIDGAGLIGIDEFIERGFRVVTLVRTIDGENGENGKNKESAHVTSNTLASGVYHRVETVQSGESVWTCHWLGTAGGVQEGPPSGDNC